MNFPLHVLIFYSEGNVRPVPLENDPRFRCMAVPLSEILNFQSAGPDPDLLLICTLAGDDPDAGMARLRRQFPAVPILLLIEDQTAATKDLPEGVTRIAQASHEDWARQILQAAAPLLAHEPEANGARDEDAAGMLGRSPAIEAVRQAIAQVADTDVTVLLRGESGTGKEVAARCLWQQSHRARFPFMKVNCAAIPCELLESELFGYEAGAFTGAIRQKPGKFELAHRGTIFFDEISEMHPLLQAKLLHVLQDGEFCRLGGRQSCRADVRVLAATNVDLEAAVAAGRFRRDLFYRLSVINIALPPLRQRSEDIGLLLEHYCRQYAAQYRRPFHRLRPAFLESLKNYSWPGNVRELENLAKRLVVMGDERQILLELATLPVRLGVDGAMQAQAAAGAPGSVGQTNAGVGLSEATASAGGRMEARGLLGKGVPVEKCSLLEIGRHAAQQAETEVILQALHQTRWNRRQAAELLQISYKALQNKMKAINLEDSTAMAIALSASGPAPTRPQ